MRGKGGGAIYVIAVIVQFSLVWDNIHTNAFFLYTLSQMAKGF